MIVILVLVVIAGYLVWLRSRYQSPVTALPQVSASPVIEAIVSPSPSPMASASASATPKAIPKASTKAATTGATVR